MKTFIERNIITIGLALVMGGASAGVVATLLYPEASTMPQTFPCTLQHAVNGLVPGNMMCTLPPLTVVAGTPIENGSTVMCKAQNIQEPNVFMLPEDYHFTQRQINKLTQLQVACSWYLTQEGKRLPLNPMLVATIDQTVLVKGDVVALRPTITEKEQ